VKGKLSSDGAGINMTFYTNHCLLSCTDNKLYFQNAKNHKNFCQVGTEKLGDKEMCVYMYDDGDPMLATLTGDHSKDRQFSQKVDILTPGTIRKFEIPQGN
jgi:hypothetical protein